MAPGFMMAPMSAWVPFFGLDEVRKVPRPRSWSQDGQDAESDSGSSSSDELGTQLEAVYDEVTCEVVLWLLGAMICGIGGCSRPSAGGNRKLGTEIGSPPVAKLSVAGVPFDKCKFLKDGTELHARHTSYLKVFGMSISASVLYMPSQAELAVGEDVTNPKVPKALEVHYMRGLSADQLRWVTRDSIAGNGFAGSMIDSGVQEFNLLYPDVACGDSLCLTYNTPDKTAEGSVTLSKNGIALGSIFGNKLSEAIYSVWFGDYVWFKQMKDDLLGAANK